MKKKILSGVLSAAMLFSSVAGSAADLPEGGVEGKIFSAASYNAEGKDQTKPDFPAENAADGDDDTVWSVFSGTVSGELILDLGESKEVNTIRLLDKGANITDYDYEYSTDGAAWVSLTYGMRADEEEKIDAFAPVNARYIKLNIYECSSNGFSIGEIEAFDDPNNTMTAGDKNLKRVFKDVDPATAEGRAIALMAALDFAHGYEDGRFRPNAQITRGEFARLISNIMREDMRNTGTDAPFIDLEEADGDLKEAVAAVYAYHIMIGDPDGRFRPNDHITGAEVVKSLVSFLGYDAAAEAKGGWSGGYQLEAVELGLLDSTAFSFDEPISRGQTALLIANALDTEVYGLSVGGNGGLTVDDSGTTLLNKYSDMYQGKGIISANSHTALDSASGAGKTGTVRISERDAEEVYDAGETDAEDYLGYRVKYYYSMDDDGHKTLVYFYEDDTTALTIPAEDLGGYNGGVEYYVNDRQRLAKVSQTAPVIMNGVFSGRLAHTLTDEDMNISSGDVTLIDNDSAAGYEVVIIRSYIDGLVDGVSTASDTILLKGQTAVSFQPDKENHVILKDGQEITREELKTFDVVSVMSSADGETVTVNVSPYAPVTAKIESAGRDTFIADGITYELAGRVNYNNQMYDDEKDLLNALSVGADMTIYLNMGHKVVGIFSAGSTDAYGYLLNIMGDEMDLDAAYVKLVNTSSQTVVLPCAEKIKFNGRRMTGAEAREEILSKGDPKQLIRYSTDEANCVKSITTADAVQTGAYYENDGALIPFSPGFAQQKYTQYATRFVGKAAEGIPEFSVDDATIVIGVPTSGDERDFSAMTRSNLSNGTSYMVWPYNVTKSGRADIVLVQVGAAVSDGVDEFRLYPSLVVDAVQAVNRDGEVVYQLTCANRDGVREFYCDPEIQVIKKEYQDDGTATGNTVNGTIEEVKPGAVVVFDPAGDIKTLLLKNIILGTDGKPMFPWAESYGYDAENVFGKAMVRDETTISIEVQQNGTPFNVYYSTGNITTYYLWNQETGTYQEAALSDILAADSVGEDEASYVFCSPRQKTMFIFNY